MPIEWKELAAGSSILATILAIAAKFWAQAHTLFQMKIDQGEVIQKVEENRKEIKDNKRNITEQLEKRQAVFEGKFMTRELCSQGHKNLDERLRKIEKNQDDMRLIQERMHVQLAILIANVNQIGQNFPGYKPPIQLSTGAES